MKNVRLKITDNRVIKFDGGEHKTSLDGKTIREATIHVDCNYDDGDEFKTAFMVCSTDTDSKHFNDFLGHIKYKLRGIFENAENDYYLAKKLYDTEIVQRELYYITDIK